MLDVDGSRIALRSYSRNGVIDSAPRPRNHEELLRTLSDLTPTDAVDVPAHDRAIGDLVREWLTRSGNSTDAEVTVLAALHVFAPPEAGVMSDPT